ncbi:MAG: hypothetical protein LJE93_11870 [Acidobacteria bacterium]|nr:hypothetical protein [Acidobacteriota bacterium]
MAFVLVAAPLSSAENEQQPAEDVGTIMVAFGAHIDTHPMAGADDLYKFLHQAVFGPGHAISNREAAERWMHRELADLGPSIEGEPFCEALGGEPLLVRVNLRPFLANGRDPAELVDAFVSSADGNHGTARRMRVVLELAASYLGCAGRGELAPALEALAAELGERDFPAIHHSEAYLEAYRPAYRVVLESLAAAHGWCESR